MFFRCMGRTKYDMRTRWHRLGSNMSKHHPLFPVRTWGNTFVEGKPRVGKTAHVTKRNFYADYPKKLIRYKIVRNFAFRISDFSTVQDWISLGFTSDAANIMRKMALIETYHHDRPESFRELIVDLPEKKTEIDFFNKKYQKYGLTLDHNVFPVTKNSMLTKLDFIQDWFKRENDARQLIDLTSLLANYDHLIIDLGFTRGNANYQQTMVGKILEMLARRTPYNPARHTNRFSGFDSVPDLLCAYRPLIIFEEAANLFPDYSTKNEQETPSSVIWGRKYAFELQKFLTSSMFIFQMESQIDKKILEQSHCKLLFKGASGQGSEFTLAKKCLWSPEDNRRSAYLIRENDSWAHFEPFISACRS